MKVEQPGRRQSPIEAKRESRRLDIFEVKRWVSEVFVVVESGDQDSIFRA